MEEDNDTIPCELCNMQIPCNSYLQHVRVCTSNRSGLNIPISFFLDERTERSAGDENEEGTNFAHNITNSRQVGGNLRSFLRRHFNDDELPTHNSRSSSPYGTSPQQQNLMVLNIRNIPDSFFDKVDVGVSNIDSISEMIDKSNLDSSETICVICQDEIDETTRRLQCNHCFCNKCIIKWFEKNNKCPICNRRYD